MKLATVNKTASKVACPSCHQPVGESCKTSSGGRAAFPHTSRIKAATEVKKIKKLNAPPSVTKAIDEFLGVPDTGTVGTQESFSDYFAEVVGAPPTILPAKEPATVFNKFDGLLEA